MSSRSKVESQEGKSELANEGDAGIYAMSAICYHQSRVGHDWAGCAHYILNNKFAELDSISQLSWNNNRTIDCREALRFAVSPGSHQLKPNTIVDRAGSTAVHSAAGLLEPRAVMLKCTAPRLAPPRQPPTTNALVRDWLHFAAETLWKKSCRKKNNKHSVILQVGSQVIVPMSSVAWPHGPTRCSRTSKHTSGSMVTAATGGTHYSNVMHDKRVVRGSTFGSHQQAA
ncbi:unnamed protein product, partial [Leptidea sinapis]